MRSAVRSGGGVAVALVVSLLTGCGGSSPSQPLAPTPTPTPTATATARYEVTFTATWSAATHPTDIPANPHFSSLIGATHDAATRFWQAGALASDGIKDMAERGRTSPLDAEVQAAIARGGAQHLLAGASIPRSPATVRLEFTATPAYSRVTLVSMIAPSPDWFVGVSALDLIAAGDWRAEVIVDLYPWDAGTDSGTTYLAADLVSVPRQPIARLQGPPFLSGGTVPPLGRFVFRRLE